MNDFTYMWLVVASISLIFFLAQLAISEENPSGTIIMQGNNLIIRQYAEAGLNDSNIYAGLPDASSGENANNDYTDEYRVTQGWIGSLIGKNYLSDALDTPFNLLKSMGLPPALSNAMGAFWWGLLILLTVMMVLGKER